jgi:hypothetical protein
MTTAVSKSGKSAVDFKQIMKDTAGIGTSVLGFAAGHMTFGLAPASLKTGMKGILAAVFLVLIGGFIAVKAQTVDTPVKRNTMLGFGTGMGTYGVIKAINIGFGMMPVVGGGPVATAGIEGIPEGLRNFVTKLVPNLGDADPIPFTQIGDMDIYAAGDDIGVNAVDTEYEFVSGTDDLDVPVFGADELNFGAAVEPTFNAISGVGEIHFA